MTQPRPTTLPVWADTGDKAQPSNSEISNGWPNTTVPPSRQRFNWILNFIANGMRYLLQRGIADWDAAEEYPVGGKVTHAGLEYKALQVSTNKNPASEPTYWVRWGFTADDFESVNAGVGRQEVANKTIIQWGNGTTVAGTANIVFSQAFPNACRRIIVVDNNAVAWGASNLTVFGVSARSASGATIKSLTWNGAAFSPAVGDFDYIAIGD